MTGHPADPSRFCDLRTSHDGTSLRGFLLASCQQLVDRLWEPQEPLFSGPLVQWYVEFQDGTLAAISSHDAVPAGIDHYFCWHIRGFNRNAYLRMRDHLEAVEATKAIVPPATGYRIGARRHKIYTIEVLTRS